MQTETCEVLVAGSGPTGLTAAVELARRGIDVRIVERQPAPNTGTRARGLSARTMEIMGDLGVANRLQAVGSAKRTTLRTYDATGDYRDVVIGADPSPRLGAPHPRGLICSTARVEEALRDLLADLGVHVAYDSAVVGLTQRDDGAHVMIRGGDDSTREVVAGSVIGADGGRSTVRRLLELPFEPAQGTRWLQQTTAVRERVSVVADLMVQGIDREEVNHMWPTGVFLAPNPKAETFWFTASLQPGADGTVTEPTLESCQRLFRERTGRTDITFTAAPWMSTYRFNARMVSRFREGRVFVAGDAAHVHLPAGGQGMNTGIQDAYNLGWKLAAVLRGAGADLLETYHAERHPVAARVLRDSSSRGVAMMVQAIAQRFLRRIPALGSAFWRWWGGSSSQLEVDYRRSPLSRGSARGLRVRAGDRVPDACLLDVPSRRTTQLFELFRGTHWTVVGLGDATANAVYRAQTVLGEDVRAVVIGRNLRDVRDEVRLRIGSTTDAVLVVRPDGYVSLVCGPDDEVIVDHLRDRLPVTVTRVG